MDFSEGFIASIENSPVAGVIDACKMTLKELKLLESNEWTEEEHKLLWEAATFIELIISTNDLNTNHPLPEATGNMGGNCSKLEKYIKSVLSEVEEHTLKLNIKTYKSRYKSALKASFAYEFSQGDLDRVQVLVNELRDHITDNEHIQADHKRRLLKRLEQLQSELHKRVSDLDRFWGLVGDAGVVLGKLGTDAKPIVDRIVEIATITWQTQARTEELPSNSPSPMLKQDKDT